jgi:hypothetical protein
MNFFPDEQQGGVFHAFSRLFLQVHGLRMDPSQGAKPSPGTKISQWLYPLRRKEANCKSANGRILAQP